MALADVFLPAATFAERPRHPHRPPALPARRADRRSAIQPLGEAKSDHAVIIPTRSGERIHGSHEVCPWRYRRGLTTSACKAPPAPGPRRSRNCAKPLRPTSDFEYHKHQTGQLRRRRPSPGFQTPTRARYELSSSDRHARTWATRARCRATTSPPAGPVADAGDVRGVSVRPDTRGRGAWSAVPLRAPPGPCACAPSDPGPQLA